MKKILSLHKRQKRGNLDHRTLWVHIMQGVFLGAFAAGVFMANLMGREAVSNAGILNDYFVEKFQYTEINGQNLFFYIFGERIPLLLLLCFLAFTSLGVIAGILVIGWQGFSIGFMLSAAIAKYGIKGILLALGGLFPQYLFYAPVYILCCWFTIYLRQRLFRDRQEQERDKRYTYMAGLLISAGLFVIFVTGIFLESYINPVILKKILKIF
ncbi:stage II sporulation protein M [Lachnospiraceae bacterium 45-W7]